MTTDVNEALWFLGRGTGVVSLVLFSVVVALGIASRAPRPLPWLPRFAVTGVHRNASLLAVTFLALHAVTLLLDPLAQLRILDLVLPFGGAYRPFWLGLGALASDLVAALVVTSLLRHRLGPKMWKGIHWLAYAAWPVALLHSLGTGTDAFTPWFLTVTVACCALVIAALGWRYAKLPIQRSRALDREMELR